MLKLFHHNGWHWCHGNENNDPRLAPIRLLLESQFNLLSFCAVLTYKTSKTLTVTWGIPCCPLLTDYTGMPDKASECIWLWSQRWENRGVGLEVGKRRQKKKKYIITIRNYSFWIWVFLRWRMQREKISKKKGVGWEAFLFTFSCYRWSRPASLFYQEKMLIINLRLHATSLFNSW